MNAKKIGFVAVLILGSVMIVSCSDDKELSSQERMWIQQKMLEEKYGSGTKTTTTTQTVTQTVTSSSQ